MVKTLIFALLATMCATFLWGCGGKVSYTTIDGTMLGTTLHVVADVQGTSPQELYAAVMALDREAKASMSIFDPASLLRRLAHEEGKCIFFSTHDLDVALGLCDATALIDTPTLHCMSAADMAASGHIERLFAGAGISFDPATLTIRLAKK